MWPHDDLGTRLERLEAGWAAFADTLRMQNASLRIENAALRAQLVPQFAHPYTCRCSAVFERIGRERVCPACKTRWRMKVQAKYDRARRRKRQETTYAQMAS